MIRRSPIRKRSAKARLISEADKLVRQLVMARDRRCTRCGKTDRLQAAHILPKGKYPRLRFELLNVVAMCVGCHLYFWHRDPLEARDWFNDEFPGRYDQLQVLAAVAPRVDIKTLLVALRLEVKALDSGYSAPEPRIQTTGEATDHERGEAT